MGEAYVRTVQKFGLAASIKHFPGDGQDERDQHLVTSINSMDCDTWMATYGAAYRAGIEAGSLTAMVGHILQPAWTKKLHPEIRDEDILPGSLSPELLQGLLRGELGFNGLICTDATTMAGYTLAMSRRDAVPASIAAGCDMFLFARNLEEDYGFMLEGIRKGIITPERLNEAVTRILAVKAALGLHKGVPEVQPDQAKEVVGCARHQAWADECADRAITLVKDKEGIHEVVYKADGLYGEAIQVIISWLEKANEVAENDRQRDYTEKLIAYYRTGDLKTWDEYNILWVQDTESHIDFVNGFIEDYNDPMGMKATWESIVDFKDLEATQRSETISANAQWFEDHSPVDPRFKKEECRGVSAKSIVVTTLGGDCFPLPPIGINLPNADWIRKDYGSKSVTITNLMQAYDKAAEETPRSGLKEFAYSQEEIDLCKKYGVETDIVHTNLHECLGHGSGKLLPNTQPGALKEYSSTLEEARADLFGLYYLADPKLVELGVISDGEAYKAEYCGYIRNGLMTQLARVELGRDVTEAHMQNRKLIAEWCYEHGKENNVIERKTREGKTFFVVNDFEALRGLFGELLAEVQRIKSEGDYAAGKALVERYGVKVDPELHKEVRERYNALGLKPYGGFINPAITPVREDGRIVDYQVSYPDDFLQEHLDLGKSYSFLRSAR